MAPALGTPKSDPARARERLVALPWVARASLTVGGLGYARFAPGTWGSLPPCIAVLALVAVLPEGSRWVIDAALLAMLAWAAFGCVRWGGAAEEALGGKDPSCVVLDEVAGMSIALLRLDWPLRAGSQGWDWASTGLAGVGLAFLLFRALDILKPPPCRAMQERHGGAGILLDDVFAGIYACVVMHVVGPLAA